MSRLVPSDIQHICHTVQQYDEQFAKQTGKSMAQTACFALGKLPCVIRKKTAVIPVTSGLGTIDRFSESVCAILCHAGADAFVTQKTDVAGLQEAYLAGAEMAFLADDDVCAAFSLRNGATSDNGFATGIAFAAALNAAVSCEEQTVLVLGAGPVGTAAAMYLCQNGAKVVLYDPVLEKTKPFSSMPNVTVLETPPELKCYPYVLDATPTGAWISADMAAERAVYAAPGMPLSLTEAAVQKVTLIHNPLELGIITMYYDCAFQMEG